MNKCSSERRIVSKAETAANPAVGPTGKLIYLLGTLPVLSFMVCLSERVGGYSRDARYGVSAGNSVCMAKPNDVPSAP